MPGACHWGRVTAYIEYYRFPTVGNIFGGSRGCSSDRGDIAIGDGVPASRWVVNMAAWAKRGMLALVIGAELFWGDQAWAHHAFASTFVLDKTVTIEGRVVEFLFRNPHSVVVLETPGEKGRRSCGPSNGATAAN
jgi:hypothetical protein